MKYHLVSCTVAFGLLLSPALPGSTSALGVQGISPGARGQIITIGGECPTFSWEAVPDVEDFELVVYAIDDNVDGVADIDLSSGAEVLFQLISGRATSWTPGVERCLSFGGRYVWFIRTVTDRETGEGSDWSEPRFFQVATAPSAKELERAIEVIRRWEAASGGGSPTLSADAVPDSVPAAAAVPATATDSGSGSGSTKTTSVITGTAAIRGVQPDVSGETYGVVGTSASLDGAGIGAANTAGGPDLVLDGPVPAEFTEAGVDRSSASPQTFSFYNTGGGGLTLDIDGVDVVTTATDQDTVGGLTCGPGELPKWNGATWVCAPDLDTDTLLGLSCTPDQIARFNGSNWECHDDWDTLYNLGCGPSQIAKYNGTTWVCAEDEDTASNLGPGLILDGDQVRIDPWAFSTRITTLVNTNSIEDESVSLAIGSDGLGLIAFFDLIDDRLKVAHCSDAPCTSVMISTPDSTIGAGLHPSVAIGTDGLPIISYYAGFVANDLKVAHCADVACTSATFSHISLDCGLYSSIAIGSDGLPLIAFQSEYNGLETAHCLDLQCTSTVGSPIDLVLAKRITVAIGDDGIGLIAYHEGGGGVDTYKVAHCGNLHCTTATASIVDDPVDFYNLDNGASSLIIGGDGLGFIAYFNSQIFGLGVAHCDNAECTSMTRRTFSEVNVTKGVNPSVVLGTDGQALITHFSDHGLTASRCLNLKCQNATMDSVTDHADGKMSSVMGADGRILAAYLDSNNLKVAHLPIGY